LSKLIVIPTPIGNLGDVSDRIKSALSDVQILLAEDTRHTGKLLKLLGIEQKMLSYHKFNEHRNLEKYIQTIQNYETVGLVSDAGTPGISDPGFLIVRECIVKKIDIECLPGPNAIIPALILSGFPTDRFCFEGFIPVKKGRQTRLKELIEEKRTMVFYESPHRIERTLKDMGEHFGINRNVSLSRELTKKFEETMRGSIESVLEKVTSKKVKGELVLVVEGKK
jgi:16S rRNA (cytidine1402-2'-O)-methyltransferase